MNPCIFKYIELVLAVTCVLLHHFSYDLTDVPTLVLCSGTFIGYLVLLSGEIIGDALGAPFGMWMDVFYSKVGAMLFSASGITTACNWLGVEACTRRSVALTCAALALIAALILLVDAITALCRLSSDDEIIKEVQHPSSPYAARLDRTTAAKIFEEKYKI